MAAFMRRREVQEFLGVSKRGFYSLVDEGRIKKHYFRIDEFGNGLDMPYYARSEIERLISEIENER